MDIDIPSMLIVGINYLVYGSLFPLCWKVYYTRHPPSEAFGEIFGLIFVVFSILCGATTFSYLMAKALDSRLAGGYLFYSTVFGVILIMLATMALLDGTPNNPRGWKQTALIGFALGLVILTVANVTVLSNLVLSLG
jgi:uncharacterized BrkB/YihY/UPF0761 family membrane protein